MLIHKQDFHQSNSRLSPDLLNVELTSRAKRALAMSSQILFVEMQLHFGCMVRKELHFTDTLPQGRFIKISPDLYVGYQIVMGGEACGTDRKRDNNILPDNMIGSPHWLTIDYKKGQWTGEFGMTEKPTSTIGAISNWIREIINLFDKLFYLEVGTSNRIK